MERNWPANGGEEGAVKGFMEVEVMWGGGEGDSRFMERVWERRVGGWRERARRVVCVAWMRIVVSGVDVRRTDWAYIPEGRRGLYEKRLLKKEFVVGEVVFLELVGIRGWWYNVHAISANIQRGM